MLKEVSANQSSIFLVDAQSGEKTLITPDSEKAEIHYEARFSHDGKGVYITTDRDSEFHRLGYFDLAGLQPTYLSSDIKWDVDFLI